MEISRAKQDIDELIDEFSGGDATSFSEMKRVWASRKFSHIYEAAPPPTPYSFSNLAFFIQSLFSHCLGHVVGSASLSRSLAGLYCLYCLHETQPFKPPFRIYLSLRELQSIKDLVVAAKDGRVAAVPPLVRRMLEKNMFLYGAVDLKEGSSADRAEHLLELQNARVGLAYKKLFANTRIEHFLHMDLGLEVGMDAIKKLTLEYAEAKKLAVGEAREQVDIQDIEHIVDEEKSVRDVAEEIVDEWSAEQKAFHQQTGFSLHGPAREEHLRLASAEHVDDQNFEENLEIILSEQQ